MHAGRVATLGVVSVQVSIQHKQGDDARFQERQEMRRGSGGHGSQKKWQVAQRDVLVSWLFCTGIFTFSSERRPVHNVRLNHMDGCGTHGRVVHALDVVHRHRPCQHARSRERLAQVLIVRIIGGEGHVQG